MSNPKKRQGFSPAINVLGENKRSLAHSFSVYDPLTKYSFLVDSGSDVSALPINLAKPKTKIFKTFKGPTSNANISCVRYVNLVLDLGISKQFSWKFAVCKSLRQPILDADFLSQHSLLVDSANKRFLQAPSQRNTFIKKGKPLFSSDSK